MTLVASLVAMRRPQGRAVTWAIVLICVGAIAAGALALIFRGERAALDESQTRLTRLARSAEAALNRSFVEVDLVLADARAVLSPALAPDGALDREVADGALLGVTRRNLLLRDLVVLDRDGEVLAAARSETRRLGVPLPAGFTDRALSQAAPRLAIGEPAVSLATSEHVIHFARPLRLASGTRALVVAEVPLR